MERHFAALCASLRTTALRCAACLTTNPETKGVSRSGPITGATRRRLLGNPVRQRGSQASSAFGGSPRRSPWHRVPGFHRPRLAAGMAYYSCSQPVRKQVVKRAKINCWHSTGEAMLSHPFESLFYRNPWKCQTARRIRVCPNFLFVGQLRAVVLQLCYRLLLSLALVTGS